MSNPSFPGDTSSGHGSQSCRSPGAVRRTVPSASILVAFLAGVLHAAQNASQTSPGTAVGTPTTHLVIIQKPVGVPFVTTGRTNFLGQPVFASCSSCHTTTRPNLYLRDSRDLDQFHQGLNYVHGNLTCLSCHNANNYDAIKLADGRSLQFQDSIDLCSQCHGPQRRDYDCGLHGGMRGHWDLSRGGRERNTCVNCHDPHAPAFPAVMPVLPPKDRISVPRTQSKNATASH